MFVYLRQIIVCMEVYNPVYLNLVTGELIDIPDYNDAFLDSDHEGLILIPKFDNRIIIKQFLESSLYRHKKDQVQNILSAHEKNPDSDYFVFFFKLITKIGLRDEWEEFWGEAKKQTARQWCEDNNIPYTEKTPNKLSP